MEDNKVYDLDGVSYSYAGRFEALKEVSLTVEKGEKIALLGANGTAYNWWPKGSVIDQSVFITNQLAQDFIDDDLPDHYQTLTERVKAKAAAAASSLLSSLGLGGSPVKRRRIG